MTSLNYCQRKKLKKAEALAGWERVIVRKASRSNRFKYRADCEKSATARLLGRWQERIRKDKCSRFSVVREARIKMSRVENRAGVTHRDFILVTGQLNKAIENLDFDKAKALGRKLTEIDHRLHDAAKAMDIDIAYLRTELNDAKAWDYRLSA